MEAASTVASFTRMLAPLPTVIYRRNLNNSRRTTCLRTSPASGFLSPSSGISSSFSGFNQRLNTSSSPSKSKLKRNVITMVIPYAEGNADEQPPPDLASYLFKNRIVYLGMSLVPSVTELLLAEFLYLQYDDVDKPVYLYINSTGTTKTPIFTLCVGNAWGEAALLLAAGSKGNRSALPSSTIMIKQPIARFEGQATDVELARKEINNVKAELVLYNERATEDRGVVSDVKKAQLI